MASVFLLSSIVAPRHAMALNLNDVQGQSDEELAADGWQTREIKNSKGTLKCGLASLGVSLFWQGFGHYCIGDNESSTRLSIMEGVAAVLFTSSMLIGSLSHDDKNLSAMWKSLFYYGTTLYFSSYLIDVFGTFKGNSFNLAENHLDPYGLSLGVNLRWIPSNDFNLGLQVGLTFRNERFWVKPYAYSPVTQIESQFAAGIDTGAALWYGEKTHTYFALALDAKYDGYFGEYHTLKLVPYLEFSLDLGSWFEHLANIRFVNRFGLGVNLYSFNAASTSMFEDYDTVLVLESSLNVNVVKDFNFAFTYRYRPDFVVGQISTAGKVGKAEFPGLGIFSLDLNFHLSEKWVANINANFGEDVDFWLGIVYQFF